VLAVLLSAGQASAQEQGDVPSGGPSPPPGSGAPNDVPAGPAGDGPRKTERSPENGGTEGAQGTPPGTEAAPPKETREAPRAANPPPPGGVSPKRPVPDYDGRGGEPTTADDVALWIPRILFSPLYLVSEYVIRRPLGWLIATAERKQWPSAIANFFVFGPDKKAGVVPTAFLDLGFRASVGFYAFWDDLLGEGNHLRLHFSTFGADWLQAAVADKIPVGKDAFFDVRLEGVHRPDQIFHGLGPRTLQSERSRFGIDKLQANTVFESMWWRSSRLTINGGVRYVGFREDSCCDDLSLDQRIAEGTLTAPPGYRTGYTAVFQRAELTVDTREDRPSSQTGFRMELEIEQASDVRRSASNWVRYGGSVGGYLDVKNNRTVSLAFTAVAVDPLSGGGEIPFTEQVVLGGSGLMRGYLYGRLVDRSAAVATLKYRWPIWVSLDGAIQAQLGNVFGPQLEGFDPKLFRLSTAIGIETVGAADHTFEVLLGLGTETIEHGMNLNSVRFLFGTNRGF